MQPGKQTGRGGLSDDTRTALRNAAKLTVSLLATWSVGIVVRFWLPRYLGPDRFGLLSFADGFAATALGCTTLGLDTYIQKEIPVRPGTASDFYGGTLLLRAILASCMILGLMLVPLAGRPIEQRALLVAFGIGYLVFAVNGSLAALLQANSTVDELARANVTAKVVWGIGMFAAILARLPLLAFAGVFVASEAFKATLLQLAARRRLGLRIKLDTAATRLAVTASMGFFASNVANVLGQRLDVTMLGFLARDAEVGWYGSSQTIAGITLLLVPILAAVLTPLLARSLQRSKQEMRAVLCRALEGIVSVATPVALLVALGADVWVGLAFGHAFAPAAMSLRMLAPLFLLIYVSILLATALVVQGRGWTLSMIAVAGIVTNACAGLLLAPALGKWLGAGGAGAGMALAGVVKEIVVVCCMLAANGTDTIDRARRVMFGRTALAAGATLALHLILAPLGPWRLLADACAYPLLAVGFGALRPAEVVSMAREIMSERARRPA